MEINDDLRPQFFSEENDFRKWLETNHSTEQVIWVGYYKTNSGKKSITWPESRDQALCFGWIDGIRKSIDEKSYKIRFTPRKRESHWSKVNIDRIRALKKKGLVVKEGLEAFNNRNKRKIANAAHEQKEVSLPKEFLEIMIQNPRANQYFESQSPSYRKQCTWWILSAKKEETRQNRFEILIKSSEKNEVIPPFRWSKKNTK